MATWDSTYTMWRGTTNSSQWGIWASIYELPGTTNIVNNTSVVRVDLWLGRTQSAGYPIQGTYNGYIEADRENYNGFPTQHIDISKPVNQSSVGIGPNVLVGTWDYTIQHSSDGSRNVRITTELTGQNFSPSYCVLDTVVTLSTIPRASSVNSVSAYIEGQTNIVINPYASFNHSVRVYFGNINKWLQSDGTLGTNEYIFPSSTTRPLFILPSEFYDQFTSERGYGNIYVNTYSGSTKIGESSNSLTAICNPALCNPYATATVVDVNDKTIELSGNKNDIIKYKSIVSITPTITVSSPNDTKTTLKSKAINGTIFTSDTINITNPNDKSFTLKLVNSRNMSNEIIVEASGKLIPYIPLTFSGELWRPEPTTGEVQIRYSGNYFNQNFRESSGTGVVSVGDKLTSDNLRFSFPETFYETIADIRNTDARFLLKTDKYKIYVGAQGGTMPHYFVTVETLEIDEDAYNEDNFIYQADYSEKGGWYVSVNRTTINTSSTIDLGTVTEVSSDTTIANIFQDTDKSTTSIGNTLSLSWAYREKGSTEWSNTANLNDTDDLSNSVLISTIPENFGKTVLENWDGENNIIVFAQNNTYKIQYNISESRVWVSVQHLVNETNPIVIYQYISTIGDIQNNKNVQLPSDFGTLATINKSDVLYTYLKTMGKNYLTHYTLDGNTYSGEESLGTIFDYRKQYEFVILYNDKLSNETSSIYSVTRGLPIFWWGEDSVHIMNKLYVGDNEIGQGDVYSTEEMVIGTWIDGKPIYRKVYYYDSITFTTGEHILNIDLPNLDCACGFKYCMWYPTLNRWYVNWDTIDAHNTTITSTKCTLGSGGGNTTFTRASFVFEYTKTTDKGTEG